MNKVRNIINDLLFSKFFPHIFCHSMTPDDTDIEYNLLNIGPDSKIFAISSTGDAVAALLSYHPKQVDCIDINRSHLAITALKINALKKKLGYEDYYNIFGRGYLKDPKSEINKLTKGLPEWICRYWNKKINALNEACIIVVGHLLGYVGFEKAPI